MSVTSEDTSEDDGPRITNIRDPAITLLEARLLASSADKVWQWLRTRAEGDPDKISDSDEDLEQALLARADPLINLALAQYGIEETTLQRLFASEDLKYRRALRLAVLSNQAIRRKQYHRHELPTVLTGRRAPIGPWLAALSDEELSVLFANPTLNDEFLIDFLETKKGWAELSESRQLLALRTLTKNPRMWSEYKSVIMDGYAEYKHGAVFNAAWRLALVAPTHPAWCWILSELYSKMGPSRLSLDEPLTVARRWFPDPSNASSVKAEEPSGSYLGAFAQIRQQLGRIALNGPKDVAALLSHEDLAIRASAYRYGNLTPAQIEAAVAKDPQYVFEQVVRNEWLWMRAPTRELLKKLAWEQPDPSSYMDAPNLFRFLEAGYRKTHPKWFSDEDEADKEPVDEDSLPVTRGELKQAVAEITGQIQLPFSNIANVERAAALLVVRSRWFAWGIALLLALVLYAVVFR